METGSIPQVPAAPIVAPASRRFGPSPRALAQRQALLWAVKGLALGALVLLALIFSPPFWWAALLKWAIVLGLGWGVWQMPGTALLGPIQRRFLLLHEQALEVNRDGFRRFVVFEGIQHIQAIQGRDERLIALRLLTADDTVVLRDIEGLGEVFAALSAHKSKGVLIEVEHRPIDWGEPLAWAVALGAGALLLCLLLWLAPWQKASYVIGDGRLMLLNGGGLALWRPASRGALWHKQAPEVAVGCMLFLFGQILLR
jgi:hypothetical protein